MEIGTAPSSRDIRRPRDCGDDPDDDLMRVEQKRIILPCDKDNQVQGEWTEPYGERSHNRPPTYSILSGYWGNLNSKKNKQGKYKE